MIKNKVWTVVKKKDVLKIADIIDSTWAMKKKANGQYHACLAARGFKQTHGKSFVYHNISSLVVHDINGAYCTHHAVDVRLGGTYC